MKMITSLMGAGLIAALVTGSALPHPNGILPGLPEGQTLPGKSASAAAPDFFKGYTIEEAVFKGNILGEDFELTGTVQQVFKKLQAKHPGHDLASRDIVGVGGSNGTYDGIRPKVNLKRDKILPPLCIPIRSQPWNFAYGYATDNNIHKLERIGGVADMKKKSCSKLACSDVSAIWLCNDNDYRITPNMQYISSYAYDLRHKCKVQPPVVWWDLCGGQEFDDDSYNVIVHDATC